MNSPMTPAKKKYTLLSEQFYNDTESGCIPIYSVHMRLSSHFLYYRLSNYERLCDFHVSLNKHHMTQTKCLQIRTLRRYSTKYECVDTLAH